MTDLQKLAGALCQLMPLNDPPADFVDLVDLKTLDTEWYSLAVTFQARGSAEPLTATKWIRKDYFRLFGIGSIARKVMECVKTP